MTDAVVVETDEGFAANDEEFSGSSGSHEDGSSGVILFFDMPICKTFRLRPKISLEASAGLIREKSKLSGVIEEERNLSSVIGLIPTPRVLKIAVNAGYNVSKDLENS